jgi:hypothetical protein
MSQEKPEIAAGVEVHVRAVGAEAADRTAEQEDERGCSPQRQRAKPRSPSARYFDQFVRERVGGDAQCVLAGAERDREQRAAQPRGRGGARFAKPAIRVQSSERKRDRDQRVAVGDPAERDALRLIDAEQQQREQCDARAEPCAKAVREEREHGAPPQRRVHVIAERGVVEDRVIERGQCARERPQHRQAQGGVREPRIEAVLHDCLHVFG